MHVARSSSGQQSMTCHMLTRRGHQSSPPATPPAPPPPPTPRTQPETAPRSPRPSRTAAAPPPGDHRIEIHEPRFEDRRGQLLQRAVHAAVQRDLVVQAAEDAGDGALFTKRRNSDWQSSDSRKVESFSNRSIPKPPNIGCKSRRIQPIQQVSSQGRTGNRTKQHHSLSETYTSVCRHFGSDPEIGPLPAIEQVTMPRLCPNNALEHRFSLTHAPLGLPETRLSAYLESAPAMGHLGQVQALNVDNRKCRHTLLPAEPNAIHPVAFAYLPECAASPQSLLHRPYLLSVRVPLPSVIEQYTDVIGISPECADKTTVSSAYGCGRFA